MSVRLSRTQARAWGVTAKAMRQPKSTRADGYDSQLEADYATYLERDEAVRRWVYHPWQFLLVPGKKPVRYTPDFLVFRVVGPPQIVEVKGYWRTADRIRIKLCASRYPEFQVLGVTRLNRLWQYESFS